MCIFCIVKRVTSAQILIRGQFHEKYVQFRSWESAISSLDHFVQKSQTKTRAALFHSYHYPGFMSLIVDQINAYVNPDELVDVQARAFEHLKHYVLENSMQDLIELLEEKLVGGEDRERNRATTLLADLFHSTKFSLHPSVIHLYAVFFCHRLSDYPSIIPSLHALTALVQLYGAEFEPKYSDALDIFQAIFRSIVVPTYPQTVRHKVLKLFRELLANEAFVASLQSNAADILNGLISSIEEEKDPRCLLEVFSLMSSAFSAFSHALTTEVVLLTDEADGSETQRTLQLAVRGFESLSCYFPITFNPPPNDPFGITPQALTSTLEDCLCTYYSSSMASSDNDTSMDVANSTVDVDAFDGNAMVRQSVGFFLKQLTSDLYIGKLHALRALARIVRTNPLRHRVFALIPVEPEGDYAPSGANGREESSQRAVDAELFAMVEDGDEETDYADLHIQSTHNSNLSASKTSLTPQQRLLNELSQLQGTLYRLATENESAAEGGPGPEGGMELVAGALQLIGQIAAAIGTEFGADGTSVDWQTFGAPLLDKIFLELSTDLSSAKAKASIDIAYVIARMGGNACCAAVLAVLAPQLAAITSTTQTNLKKEVQRAAQDAVRRVDRVLNLNSGSSNSKGVAVGVSSEDGRLAMGIEMLAQLIACVGAAPLELTTDAGSNNNNHDHTHGHTHGHSSGGCGGSNGGGCGGHGHSHDHSHSHTGSCNHDKATSSSPRSSSSPLAVSGDVSVLLPHADAMFQVLAAFVQPSVIALEGNENSVAVNPFLAVKSAFTETAESAADVVMVESKLTVFSVPAAVVLAIVASISAMRELIARCQLPAAEVTTYVERVTKIAIHGVSVLFPTADPSTLAVQTNNLRAPALETLHRACVSFLVSLGSASGDAYRDILQGHAVALLLSAVRTASAEKATQASIDNNVFPLLSALVGAVEDSSLLRTIVPALTVSTQDIFSNENVSEGLPRLLLVVQALCDIVPSAPTAATLSAVEVVRNAEKAGQLINNGSGDSAVLTVLQLVHSHIDRLLDAGQSAEVTTLLDTLYTFVRRLCLSLPSETAQTALALSLIDVFLPAHSSDSNKGQISLALSATQLSLSVGLVTNALACLDKNSALFQAIGTSEVVVARCVDYALHSVRTVNSTCVELKVLHSGVLADFGAAQLIAVIANKVHAPAQCVSVIGRVLATFRDLHTATIATTTATATSQQEFTSFVDSLLLWTLRAVNMRAALSMTAEVAQEQVQLQRSFHAAVGTSGSGSGSSNVESAALATTWQEFLLQDLIALLLLSVPPTDPHSGTVKALQLRLASQLHVLTVDHAVILSSSLRATATQSALFWKQKLWNRLFTPLSQSKPMGNVNLVAICALTEGMPMNVLQDSLTLLVEVVVTAVSRAQSEGQKEGDVRVSCATETDAAGVLAQQSLRTLEKLLGHDAQLFVSHLNVIVPALMETSQQASAARLRATALEALLIITEHIPYLRLFPFKTLVSKGLQRTLDDRKKAVRVLAGRVRNKWIVMK